MIINKIQNTGEIKLQSKTVTPSTESQNILPDANYNALSQVNILPVTQTIDSNIVSSNIKIGKSILGVEGTLNPYGYAFHITSFEKENITNCTVSDGTSTIDTVAFDVNCEANASFRLVIVTINQSNIRLSCSAEIVSCMNYTVSGITNIMGPTDIGVAIIQFNSESACSGIVRVKIKTEAYNEINLQSKIIYGQGEVTPSTGYDGLSKVTSVLSTSSAEHKKVKSAHVYETDCRAVKPYTENLTITIQ